MAQVLVGYSLLITTLIVGNPLALAGTLMYGSAQGETMGLYAAPRSPIVAREMCLGFGFTGAVMKTLRSP